MQINTLLSSILDVLNARASVAALASGNGHLLQNPIAAIFNNPEQDNSNSTGSTSNTRNASENSSPIKNSYFCSSFKILLRYDGESHYFSMLNYLYINYFVR